MPRETKRQQRIGEVYENATIQLLGIDTDDRESEERIQMECEFDILEVSVALTILTKNLYVKFQRSVPVNPQI